VVALVTFVTLWSSPIEAASPKPITPELASQLMRIMTDADGDVTQMLAELDALAKRKRRPDDLKFIIRERAALLIQEDQLDIAERELLATLEGQDEDFAPPLRYLLGQIYLLEGDARKALPYLESWAQHAEDPDPGGLFVLAYTYVQAERFADAATLLENIRRAATVVRPQWIEVLAYVYTQMGQTDRAIDLLESLVADHPENERWWRQLATVFLIIDDVPNGTAGFTVATQLDEMDLNDARRLAQLFGYLDMPADGAVVLQQAMGRSAEAVSFEDRMLLAELWIVAREFEQAVATLEAASLIADDGEPQMVIGQLYLQRERFDDARQALAAAVVAYSEEAPALSYYLLAVAELNAGDITAAEAAITAFETDPDYGRRAQPLRDYIRSVQTQ
jgi:tetratricopeptide (TPR) repeat protein